MGGENVSRETKILLMVLASFSVIGGAAGYWLAGARSGLCALATGGMGMIAFWLYSIERSKEVHRLCEYLADVYAGNQVLDIRTQREGELSALRSELYKITTILCEQKKQLMKDKRQMADFLGDVAHQLRTPLSAILLQTELWQGQEIPENEKEECAFRIQKAAERIRWLVEQLLRLCRLDAQVVCFEKASHSACLLLHEACRNIMPLCALKGVTLECNVEESIHCFCDASWTVQALTNLIKNAEEHTVQNGSIRLWCESNALYTQFCVENSGPMIPQEEMPHLFERFWRGKNASPTSIGIGLALAKAIVQGQGGMVWAENGANGPCFFLRMYTEPR